MSANEDSPVDVGTDSERSPVEIATQTTTGVENGMIRNATIPHAYADDEGLYFELENDLAVKSTRKLTTLIAEFAAALFDELEEPHTVTIVGHMGGNKSAMAMVELDPYDFDALEESDVAFRKRVVENLERVI